MECDSRRTRGPPPVRARHPAARTLVARPVRNARRPIDNVTGGIMPVNSRPLVFSALTSPVLRSGVELSAMFRRLAAAIGGLLVLFHLWLFGSQLLDGRLTELGPVLRWLVAAGLVAAMAH